MDQDQSRGLRPKWFVQRLPEPGKDPAKHANCETFILDFNHDKFAVPALRAYADACEAEYPALAADLRAKAADVAARLSGG